MVHVLSPLLFPPFSRVFGLEAGGSLAQMGRVIHKLCKRLCRDRGERERGREGERRVKRERERETETERQRDRERESETDRQRDRHSRVKRERERARFQKNKIARNQQFGGGALLALKTVPHCRILQLLLQ